MNFFIIIIIYYSLLLFFNNFFKKQRINILFIEILCITPLILFATYRANYRYMVDTNIYVRFFERLPINFNDFLLSLSETNEKGYSILVYITKLISSHHEFSFFIIASIFLILVSFIYKKYSVNYIFSIFLFLTSNQYFSWMCNGIRQGLAIAICFASFGFILKKKYIICILFILLAFTFHNTALLFLPFIFFCNGEILNKKTLFISLIIIITIFTLDSFTSLLTNSLGSEHKYSRELELYETIGRGMNVFGFVFQAIPTFLFLLSYKKLKEINDPVINFCCNMSLITTAFYFLATFAGGILFGRIPGYFQLFNYILLPYLLNRIYKNKIYTFIIIILFLLYYFYVIINHNLLLQNHFSLF